MMLAFCIYKKRPVFEEIIQRHLFAKNPILCVAITCTLSNMKYLIGLILCAGLCHANTMVKRAAAGQNPKVFSALDILRGGANRQLGTDQIQELFLNVRPGQDFPLISEIPKANIDCSKFNQPGFYADSDSGQCQVFHRCDINGNLTSYLCPNMTLFNQITLVCDWWFNIDCSQAKQFYDYSNSRLYQEGVLLLDDEPDYTISITGAAQQITEKSSKGAASGNKKQRRKKNKNNGQ